MAGPTSKRKIQEKASSRKKAKTQYHAIDELPWKKTPRPHEAGLDGDDGVLELEEIDGVEVIYQDTEGGRVARFNVIATEETSPSSQENEEDNEQGDNNTIGLVSDDTIVEEDIEPFDSVELLPEWHRYSLHPQLLKAIHAKGFFTPSPIQSSSLPVACSGRDVVGVAQTGSGKTLAYGLPILHYLLSQPRLAQGKKRQLRALILAPTRELALQVSSHLNDCLNHIESETKTKPVQNPRRKKDKKGDDNAQAGVGTSSSQKSPPRVSIAAIVGGMSAQKQRRILDRGVDVLVATPGRLWDIMEDDDELSKEIKKLKFLVLDEADRMIEAGHFAELENILRLTLRESKDDEIETDFNGPSADSKDPKERVNDALQTFVFSATLSKDLQRNVKKHTRPKSSGKYNKRNQNPATTLDDLLLRLDFRDPDPEVIDLSPVGGVVSTLKESKIECLSADKASAIDLYPGRSLVFLSSIDGIRRLMPLIELLNIKAFPLHSQLEQRQRLKNLDRFKSIPNSVLLATDIAARGLDIPAVDHVIHYQIPRSADSYVHRNGRTARAMRKGFSMLMCAPDERRVVRTLLDSLGRRDTDIPDMTIELNILDKLKYRVQLARKIETTQHKIKKANHERNWMKETAEALEIELDSDFMSDDNEEKPSNQKWDAKNAALKSELKRLISQPLVARGVSTKYITSGSRPIVDDLIAGEYNETIVGLRKTEAGNDLVTLKKKKREPAAKKEYEEWEGISS